MTRLPVLQPMQCDDGCGRCCGPVPVTENELGAIRRYVARRGIEPVDHGGLTCPLYIDGRCSVYPVRPFLCRVFGHVPALQCVRGYRGNPVPDKWARARIRRGGRAVALLTEVFP